MKEKHNRRNDVTAIDQANDVIASSEGTTSPVIKSAPILREPSHNEHWKKDNGCCWRHRSLHLTLVDKGRRGRRYHNIITRQLDLSPKVYVEPDPYQDPYWGFSQRFVFKLLRCATTRTKTPQRRDSIGMLRGCLNVLQQSPVTMDTDDVLEPTERQRSRRNCCHCQYL